MHEDEDFDLPIYYRTYDTWALRLDTYTVLVGSVVIALIYLYITAKVITGTRSPFVIFILLAYVMFNVCSFAEAYYRLYSLQVINGKTKLTEINLAELESTEDKVGIFYSIGELCLCTALWSFSYRYWNISHIMPT